MKTKLISLMCLSLFCTTIYAEKMTFTSGKAIGSTLQLVINANQADQADVWIDLNNNGKKDAGEQVITFGTSTVDYVMGARTITIYGKVTHFSCNSNRLQSLDVSENPALQILGCNWGYLTTLDLSKNINLRQLYASRNKFSSIDLSHNPKLTMVYLDGNRLTGLNVTKNTVLQRLVIAENNIAAEDMTSLIQSLVNRSTTSAGSLYVKSPDTDSNVVYSQHIVDANAKNWSVFDKNGKTPLSPNDVEKK